MFELMKTIRVVGLRRLLRLSKAHRYAWKEMISGFYSTRVMQTLFNVGFFDEIASKRRLDIVEFAESRNLDEKILRALCDYLFSLSILKKNNSEYALDAKGEILVKVARGWFNAVYGYEKVFHSLEGMLKKERAYGKDVSRRSDFVIKGSEEIEDIIHFSLAIDIIKRNGFKKVLDLGCGEGTFLRRLCEGNGEVTGYGIDISPEAISNAKKALAQRGLQDRVHLFVEDIANMGSAGPLLQGIDAATVFLLLHEILYKGADTVIQLLKRFRDLFPGVPLIVFEVIRPSPKEMRKSAGMALPYLLHHEITHQKLAGREVWRDLFRMSGFNVINERYLRFARTSIFFLR